MGKNRKSGSLLGNQDEFVEVPSEWWRQREAARTRGNGGGGAQQGPVYLPKGTKSLSEKEAYDLVFPPPPPNHDYSKYRAPLPRGEAAPMVPQPLPLSTHRASTPTPMPNLRPLSQGQKPTPTKGSPSLAQELAFAHERANGPVQDLGYFDPRSMVARTDLLDAGPLRPELADAAEQTLREALWDEYIRRNTGKI